jgi:integrase
MANFSLFHAPEGFEIDGVPYPGIPIVVDSDTMRIEFAPTEFLIYNAVVRGKSRSPKTWKAQGHIIVPFLRFMDDNAFDWMQPTEERLAHYRNHLELERIGRARISRIMSFVVAFYEWAQRKGFVSGSAFAYEQVVTASRGILAHLTPSKTSSHPVLVPKVRRNRDIPRYFNRDEQRRIVAELDNERDRLIVELALFTGAREFEICHLTIEDIPPQSAYQSRRCYPIRIMGKGFKPGDLYVPTWLLDKTYRHAKLFDRRIVTNKTRNRGMEVPNHIFLARWGTALKPDSVYRSVAKAIQKAGLRGSFHDLRHTYAICTLDALMRLPRNATTDGHNALLELKTRMRHQSIDSTDGYLRAREFYLGARLRRACCVRPTAEPPVVACRVNPTRASKGIRKLAERPYSGGLATSNGSGWTFCRSLSARFSRTVSRSTGSGTTAMCCAASSVPAKTGTSAASCFAATRATSARSTSGIPRSGSTARSRTATRRTRR